MKKVAYFNEFVLKYELLTYYWSNEKIAVCHPDERG